VDSLLVVDEAVVVEAAQLLEVDEGARAVVVIEVDEVCSPQEY
jgi:hypothetical protein